ncbi:MAG: dihydroorotate dehydrogenase electron transfer subunit [Bdellovibrionota bacterium]
MSTSPKETLGIVQGQTLYGRYHVLHVELETPWPHAKPGNFLLVSSGQPDLILRRPMAIYRMHDATHIDILYTLVGEGTCSLSKQHAGDKLSILGPLGNEFPSPSAERRIWIVAGGIGIAPFLFWLETYSQLVQHTQIFLGFQDQAQTHILQHFDPWKANLCYSTDNGSVGFRGNVVSLFKQNLQNQKPDLVYTCGPTKMMNAVYDICKKHRISIFSSLEARMACGIGVCLSCVCEIDHDNKNARYDLVCKDGPIFGKSFDQKLDAK